MYGEPFTVPGADGDGVRLLVPGRRGVPLRPDLAARRRQHLLLLARPRDLPDLSPAPRVRQVLRNAVHWAYNPAPRWTRHRGAPNVPIDKAPETHRDARARACTPTARRGSGEQKPVRVLAPRHRQHGRAARPRTSTGSRVSRSSPASTSPRTALQDVLRDAQDPEIFHRSRRSDRLGRVRRRHQRHARRRPLPDDDEAHRRPASRSSARSRSRRAIRRRSR